MVGRPGQMSMIEALMDPRLGQNEKLRRIDALVKWYRFEKLLAKLRSPEGRPPYPALMMFKALLLAQWYGLSDADLEEALCDRLSFRRFVGLELDAATPDHTTLCRFRNALAAAGLAERLFAEMTRQLDQLGLILRRGTLVDATLVQAAVNRPKDDTPPKDPDAELTYRKKSGGLLGFKTHIAVDEGSGLVRQVLLTPANVNETVVADELIQGDEKAFYADAAYDTKARDALLRSKGIKPRIQHRPNKHHPVLPHWKKLRNKLIGRRRGRVETVFAVAKRHYGLARMRFIGLRKNLAEMHMLFTAMNLRRALVLLG